MKDIPIFILVMGVFFVLGVGLFVYAATGKKYVPEPNSPWAIMDEVKGEMQNRNLKIEPTEKRILEKVPFKVNLTRFMDRNVPQNLAQYSLRIEPMEPIPFAHEWLKNGLLWGIVDLEPDQIIGEIQVVSNRKIGSRTN